MAASIFLARLLGPVFIVASLAVLTRPRSFRALVGEFVGNPGLTYMAAVLGLLGGIAMVLTHNVWSADWRVLITLIGWTTILRALATIFAPRLIVGAGNWFLGHRSGLVVAALLTVVLGAALSYFGYSA
jgi:hypothetical protein